MKTRTLGTCTLLASLALLMLFMPGSTPVQAAPSQPAGSPQPALSDQAHIAAALNSAPVMFVENVGQFADGARFQVRGGNATIYLADDALWFTILEKPDAGARGPRDMEKFSASPRLSHSASPIPPSPAPLKGVNLKLSFVGANSHPSIEPFNRLDTHVSYFTGSDPTKWHSDVPVWGGVRYKDLYPGIDLEVTSEQGQMVPRIIAKSGANLNVVQLRVDGADKLTLEGDHLKVTASVGTYTLPLFQVAGAANAQLPQPTIVGDQVRAPFAQSTIHHSRFTIQNSSDLLYSTYLGGNNWEEGIGITVDASGAAYVIGETESPDFPTTSGVFQTTLGFDDAFVTKLNADGTALEYSTYLGGSVEEEGIGIPVDNSDHAYVTGYTGSNNFPTTSGAFQTSLQTNYWDAFVTKLNPTGTALEYSTYLGGNDEDYSSGIAVDDSSNAYVTGITFSTNFPTTLGAFQTTPDDCCTDAFVTKLNPTGTALLYSTYLGGSGGDSGNGITVDKNGAAYVSGQTWSRNFPTTTGAFQRTWGGGGDDDFVTKLNPTGTALLYSTYLGGNSDDYGGYGIAVDNNGAAYVTGDTFSANFPTTPGAFQRTWGGGGDDAFVTKLSSAGTVLLYSTYLGGDQLDGGSSIAVDSNKMAYVTGWVSSTNFPTTLGAVQTAFQGDSDGFVSQLSMGSLPPPHPFAKSGPTTGATDQPTNPKLSWGTSTGATSYEYCIDTSNNNTCSSGWTSVGKNTSVKLGGLVNNSTYYWQVRARNAGSAVQADEGAWWSLTTEAGFEETLPSIQYNSWRSVSDSNASGLGYRISKAANSTASFAFKGTAVTWVTLKGPDRGQAQVLIDGVNKGTFDDYAATPKYAVKRTIAGLTNTTHTITVKVLGAKSASATAANIVVDSFVVGTNTTEETAPAITYNTWVGKLNANASGGAFRTSGTAGAFVQFTFSGTSIDWISARGPGYGKAKVWIDGQPTQGKVVDLYSATLQWQTPISFTGLSDAKHVIKIQVLGTRNAKATGTNIVVDGFTGPITAVAASLLNTENASGEGSNSLP